jgi:hypothetical protein
MTYQIEVEYTDTFGGQPNYCWVKRDTLEIKDGTKDREIMRRIKAFAGLTGCRGKVSTFGDEWHFEPYRTCAMTMARVVY